MFELFRKKAITYLGEQKSDSFDFMGISAYFQGKSHKNAFSTVSDQTASDLGLDEFFMFADRTSSCVGQQYLYNTLREIPVEKGQVEVNENIIEVLSGQRAMRSRLTRLFSALNDPESYSIVSLIYREPLSIPVWRMYLFLILRFLPIGFLFLWVMLHSGIALIAFALSFLVNMGIHYWNKQNSWGYLSSVPQLIRLLNMANEVKDIPLFSKIGQPVPLALISLKKLRQSSKWIRIDNKLDSDMAIVAWAAVEFCHIFFLTEAISFIKFVSLLKDKNRDIEAIYTFIGLADCLLSVSYFREDLPWYCRPEQVGRQCNIDVQELYHPLIKDCVPNTFHSVDRSILLTGSNMSGKTTFIRTIGMSILVGQTLHTAFARRFRINSPVAIHSALMLADSLAEGKSFYMREVDTIKEMLDCCKTGERNLFLMDEIFKGTNTTERIAAAKAVLSSLNTGNNLIFVSTHDTELAALLEGEYDLYHFCENVDNDALTFDYKLKAGKLRNRNAIRILELTGYPPDLIQDAYHTIAVLEGRAPG